MKLVVIVVSFSAPVFVGFGGNVSMESSGNVHSRVYVCAKRSSFQNVQIVELVVVLVAQFKESRFLTDVS